MQQRSKRVCGLNTSHTQNMTDWLLLGVSGTTSQYSELKAMSSCCWKHRLSAKAFTFTSTFLGFNSVCVVKDQMLPLLCKCQYADSSLASTRQGEHCEIKFSDMTYQFTINFLVYFILFFQFFIRGIDSFCVSLKPQQLVSRIAHITFTQHMQL